MSLYLERWLNGPLWRRQALVLLAIAVTFGCCWGYWLQPQRQQTEGLWQQTLLAKRQLAALRSKFLNLPARELLPVIPAPAPFSLSRFVTQSGGRLLSWLPEEGELHLLLSWERVPPLFLQLSGVPGLSLPAFTLIREGEGIRVALTLEFTDEAP